MADLSATKYLYRIPIPRDSLQSEGKGITRNISESGAIGGNLAETEAVSVQPGSKPLDGQYRGRRADRLARQFSELADASDIGTVAFFGESGREESDGYYVVRNGDTDRPDARQNNIVSFTGTLVRKGTRQSHFRELDFNVSLVDNEFGNVDEATVGVPADATRTFWFNTVSGAQTSATPDSTVEVETNYDLADVPANTKNVDLFDANANPYGSDGVLLYDLPYQEEGFTDTKVWDTLDSAGDKVDASIRAGDALNWQKVFIQDHDFRGNPVMENGRVHVRFNLDAGSISAEEWNSGGGTWDTVSLNASNGWGPVDVDFTEVGEVAVRAQVLFEDSDDGSVYPLNLTLVRGKSRPIIAIPPNAGSVYGALPTDLETYLTPLADDEQNDPNADLGLIRRSEVRL